MLKSEGRRVVGGKEKHSVRKNSRYAREKHSNLVCNFRQRISTRKHRAAMFVGPARLVILLLIIISVCLLDVEGNLKDSPSNQVHSEVKLQPIVNMQNLSGFTALSGELRMSEVWSGAFTPEFVSLLSVLILEWRYSQMSSFDGRYLTDFSNRKDYGFPEKNSQRIPVPSGS